MNWLSFLGSVGVYTTENIPGTIMTHNGQFVGPRKPAEGQEASRQWQQLYGRTADNARQKDIDDADAAMNAASAKMKKEEDLAKSTASFRTATPEEAKEMDAVWKKANPDNAYIDFMSAETKRPMRGTSKDGEAKEANIRATGGPLHDPVDDAARISAGKGTDQAGADKAAMAATIGPKTGEKTAFTQPTGMEAARMASQARMKELAAKGTPAQQEEAEKRRKFEQYAGIQDGDGLFTKWGKAAGTPFKALTQFGKGLFGTGASELPGAQGGMTVRPWLNQGDGDDLGGWNPDTYWGGRAYPTAKYQNMYGWQQPDDWAEYLEYKKGKGKGNTGADPNAPAGSSGPIADPNNAPATGGGGARDPASTARGGTPDDAELVAAVIKGDFGNGEARKTAIDAKYGAGTYDRIQPLVTEKMKGAPPRATSAAAVTNAQKQAASVPPPRQGQR